MPLVPITTNTYNEPTMLENIDPPQFDHSAAIANKGIDQHEHNRNELLRELGLMSLRGGIWVIDPEKLHDFVLNLNHDRPEPTQ